MQARGRSPKGHSCEELLRFCLCACDKYKYMIQAIVGNKASSFEGRSRHALRDDQGCFRSSSVAEGDTFPQRGKASNHVKKVKQPRKEKSMIIGRKGGASATLGMTRGGRRKLIGALAALMAMTLTAGMAFGLSDKTRTASAARSNDAWVTIDEICNDDAAYFKAGELKKLSQALAGSDVTTAKNGDVILDLWQSTNNASSIYTHQWASWDKNDSTVNYPSNMYSTSLIRVQTLNAGGQYSTDGSNLSANQPQDRENLYARFTMDDAPGSLTGFIAKPSQVGYQETENNNGMSNVNYTLPNDAYGTDISQYTGTKRDL